MGRLCYWRPAQGGPQHLVTVELGQRPRSRLLCLLKGGVAGSWLTMPTNCCVQVTSNTRMGRLFRSKRRGYGSTDMFCRLCVVSAHKGMTDSDTGMPIRILAGCGRGRPWGTAALASRGCKAGGITATGEKRRERSPQGWRANIPPRRQANPMVTVKRCQMKQDFILTDWGKTVRT